MLTSHRILLAKSGLALEIPLHFILKHKEGGGIIKSTRVELFLNREVMSDIAPPHEV